MTNTGLDAAHLVAENKSRLDYLKLTIPVTCNCGDFKDVVTSQQYVESAKAALISFCPNCKGGE